MKKFFSDLVIDLKSLWFSVIALFLFLGYTCFLFIQMSDSCLVHIHCFSCTDVWMGLSFCTCLTFRVLYLLIKKCIEKINKKNVLQ